MSPPEWTTGGKARTRIAAALVVAAAAIFALAVAPAAATAAPPPPQPRDTATATGDNVITDDFSAAAIDIDASSGPAGEDAQGTAFFAVLGYPISGPVSCLKVTGNVAVLEIEGPIASIPGLLSVIVRLTDNGGNGQDRFEWYPVLPEIGQDLDCETGALGWFGGRLLGRAVVTDAPAGPASKADCRNGGWARFGFRNQGLCVRSVR